MLSCLPESAKIVEALTPAADAGGRTGDYVTLKNAGMCYIVCHINQGNAATVTLTPYQASDVSATGEKVIDAVPIWVNLDCAASDALVEATAAANYTTDAGVKHKIVIFQINPSILDTANGFTSVTIKTGASNAANITQAMYHLTDYAHQGKSLPSAITD